MKYQTSAFALVLLASLLACACPARAEIIGVEPFTYADGPIAGKSGGTFWDWQNIVPTSHTGTASDWNNVSGTPAVTSGRLVTANNSALREYNGANESNGAVNDDNVNKQVYYRVTLTTGPTLPDYFGLSSYDFPDERIFFGKRFGQTNFGIEGAGVSTNSTTPIAANTTYTLVARLDFDDNLVRLYVDPDLSQAEPATATVSASYTDTFWSTAVRLASGAGGAVTWDNLAVATSWEDLRTQVTTIADENNGLLGGGSGVSLREAVNYSPSGSFITFAPGLDGRTITLTNGQITITNDLTIDASVLASGITISGNTSSRIFQVNAGVTVTLESLTIRDGYAPDGDYPANSGGGILNLGNLTVTSCTLTNNKALLGLNANGGGIANDSATNTVNNSTFSGNSSGVDGGGINVQGGSLTVNNSTFFGNSTQQGGGIWSFYATLKINHSTFTANFSATLGGGIYRENGSFALTNTIVVGNSGGISPDIRLGPGPFSGANNFTNGDALLAPLGNYGGPTPTMPLLPGSLAVDAGSVIVGLTTDQRGSARNVGAAPDIGAVESGGLWVQNTNNSGTNSLRDVLLSTAGVPNSKTVLFSPGLSGATITLGGEIVLGNNVTIDATTLTGGLTLSGGNTTRHFTVNSGSTVALLGLTLTAGNPGNVTGGAIQNNGALALTRCTLSGNFASFGGAVFCQNSTLLARNCTFATNVAARFGGAIVNNGGKMTFTHCTLALNQALGQTFTDGGGAIDNYGGGALTLTACILAGNTAFTGTGPELFMEGGPLAATNCLVGNGTSSTLMNGVNGNLVGTGGLPIDALLAPLGNYGGSTQIMPPLPGSPAINAAGVSSVYSDQRGYPRPVGLAADIGAVEGVYIAAGPSKLTGATRLADGSFKFAFTNYSVNSYTVLASTNVATAVGNWTSLGAAVESPLNSGQFQFTDPQATNNPKRFYRVRTP